MTILPNCSKKKTPQGNNGAEIENNEASASAHSGHQHPTPNHSNSLQSNVENVSRGNLYLSSSSPPPCWSAGNGGNTVREEKRNTHSSPKHFEEDSSIGKRRYRVSPLRSVRPKLREHRNGNTSPPYPSTSNVWNHKIPRASSPLPVAPQAGPSQPTENDEDHKGYNSGDEYEPFQDWNLTKDQWEEKERWFEKKMKKKNWVIKKMKEDGACLFRAIADQVYGDEDFHGEVRTRCLNYIELNVDTFQPFIAEPLQTYIERKRRDDCFGNHIEIAAMSEMYNRVIELYCYGSDPINIFQGSLQTDNAPIRLTYHKGTHYNSLIDPFTATIGVGLGLPNLQPGQAEKNLMVEATRQSETFHLEQTMLEDKIRATDFEATSDAIEEQVAQQSYLEWLRTQSSSSGESRLTRGKNSPNHKSPEAGTSYERPCTAYTGKQSPATSKSPRGAEGCSKLDLAVPGSSKDPTPSSSRAEYNGLKLNERDSFLNQLPPDAFGINDYSSEEANILAQVLAASQQEYLDSLKSHKKNETSSPTHS